MHSLFLVITRTKRRAALRDLPVVLRTRSLGWECYSRWKSEAGSGLASASIGARKSTPLFLQNLSLRDCCFGLVEHLQVTENSAFFVKKKMVAYPATRVEGAEP